MKKKYQILNQATCWKIWRYLFFTTFLLYAHQIAYANFYKQDIDDKERTEVVLEEIEEQHQISFTYESDIAKNSSFHSNGIDNDAPYPTSISSPKDKNLNLGKTAESLYDITRKEDREIKVTGQVISSDDGFGLPGVNIIVKGTLNGMTTDIEGNYAIEVPDGEAILTFSYIGYQSQEVIVGNQVVINVVLAPDVQQLGEVVVTAVGIESNKAELGYSVQNVSADEILNSREANLSTALSGKVAGVQVTSSSGSPGASATVRIRGNRSITGGNGPLYVVDGVPVSNGSSGGGSSGVDVSNRAIDINPNDIEKLTVLKGPAATVLYGSRAANGAIMITTKSGKQGKPVVTFSSAYGMSEVNKLPEKQYEYAQGRPVGGTFIHRGPETGESNSYGPLISELEFDGDPFYPYDSNGKLVRKGMGNGQSGIAYNDYDALWIKGHSFDNNLSVAGGTAGMRYYVSVGDLYQTGVTPNADFRRTSFKSNLDAELTEKIKIGTSITFVKSGGNRIQRGSNVSGLTVGIFRNTPTFDIGNGKQGQAAADDPSSYYIEADGTQRAYRGNAIYDNPFWVVNNNPYKDDVNRMIGNLSLSYKLLDWITLSYKVGLDRYTDTRNYAWDVNSSSNELGKVGYTIRQPQRINSDFLIAISKPIYEDLNLNAILGHNFYDQKSKSASTTGTDLAVPGYFNIKNAAVIEPPSEDRSQSRYYGVFADIKLNFREYLYLNLSGRNDWSSTLPANNNSFFYPAASIGFDITEFTGMSNTPILSYAKVRASYGQVGNSPSTYRTLNYYDNANVDGDPLLGANEFPAFGVNAYERSGRDGNSDLKPELTTSWEFGADLKLFKGRAEFDITYYKSFTSDAIVSTQLSAPSGFTSITLNAGEIENQGWEISASGTPLKISDFIWDIDITFSKNRSLVKSLPEDIESVTLASFSAVSSVNLQGHPFGILSGTRYSRNDKGQLIIGEDGWPLIDDEQGPIGDPNPDWLLGIRNTFSYKDFSLSFLWDIRQGGDIWNGTKGVMDYLGVSKESGDLRDVRGYVWEGVNENGEINNKSVDFANPVYGLNGIKWRKAGTLLGLAEENIEDGSWVRLRDLTLNYALPQKWVDSVKGIGDVSLSIYGRNLLLFTDYSGVDPETNLRGASSSQGWDYFNMPNTKTYGVSLKATFK